MTNPKLGDVVMCRATDCGDVRWLACRIVVLDNLETIEKTKEPGFRAQELGGAGRASCLLSDRGVTWRLPTESEGVARLRAFIAWLTAEEIVAADHELHAIGSWDALLSQFLGGDTTC